MPAQTAKHSDATRPRRSCVRCTSGGTCRRREQRYGEQRDSCAPRSHGHSRSRQVCFGNMVSGSYPWTPTPLAGFRVGPPAGTCFHIYAATVARFGRAILGPVHPLYSIRRFHRCGVGRPIALHACQLLKPTVSYPCMSAVRSRRPAVSAFASESHLRSPGEISGPAGQPARPTRASSLMHRFARDQPSPSICSRNPQLPVAARRESPF
jgi:hypothetical protein